VRAAAAAPNGALPQRQAGYGTILQLPCRLFVDGPAVEEEEEGRVCVESVESVDSLLISLRLARRCSLLH
jgi:hypothetical protein